jgi:hypothetical protein
MSTTKAEFQDLAAELISGEFADFTESTVLNQLGAFDYNTQAAAVVATSTIEMIKYDYKINQYDGEKIKIGDFMLIGERQLVSFEPSVDNTQVIYDGAEVNLNDVEIDPASASVILHVRPQ